MKILLIALLLLTASGAARAEVLVVVHPDVSEAEIEERTLERIFLGKKTRWDDETPIVPVMLKDGPLHEEFVEEMLDRPVARFVTYWKQAVFTGRGVPPRSFETEDELLFYVSRTPGAVGYASSAGGGDGVRVLLIDD